MAVIKCKMCGGDLVIESGSTVAECEYCGSRQTVPTADNEKKLTLFARANRLRAACEFDKAAGVYESIVADFPEEAEAYWGLVLCKYGIEYVDDPATGKKIPTCHRSSFDSILEDGDFEQALENADAVARKVYREEAKQIEETRKGIIEVSGKERPYDIFICYKETDENGERTIDSVIAQDVYDALTAKGYRVFFSRITLEDKLGQEYEPYIFAALNSAKIMLAFGTDYEYYNAVWVKNEWSRYLKLMASDKSKHLIPCYKGIDAYDMPREFAKLQAQDMGKVGAIQDLLRGVDKILNYTSSTEAITQSTAQEVVRTIEREKVQQQSENAVTMGIFAVDSGNAKDATKYFEEALKLDDKCIGAYLGLARVINNSIKATPYVNKLKTFSVIQVLDYISGHKEIIGDTAQDNNLLTISIWLIHWEELVRGLLNMGVSATAKDALIQYINHFGDPSVVEQMIAGGANVNATKWLFSNYSAGDSYESYYNTQHSVLSTAVCTKKNKAVIELLIKAGANVNYEVREYFYSQRIGESNGKLVQTSSILALAVRKSPSVDILEQLILAGADVNYLVKGETNETCPVLSYAVIRNLYEHVKILLEHGADPNQKRVCHINYKYKDEDEYVWTFDTEEFSPISDSLRNSKDTAVLELLISYGANLNVLDKRMHIDSKNKLLGYSKACPLKDAIFNGDNFVRYLLDNGVDPNSKFYFEGNFGNSSYDADYYKSELPLLGVAIIGKKKNVVDTLLKYGASFSEEAVCKIGECHIHIFSDSTYEWKEDRFPLSKYNFSDEQVAEVEELIRENGWRGNSSSWVRKNHKCYFMY